MSIGQTINEFLKPASEVGLNTILYSVNIAGLEVRLLLVWFIVAALFFTVYLGFVNFRYFFHGIDIIRGKFDSRSDDGQISSFQALMASLSGTVGLGNIAGVAAAVSLGGPGAVFWMIVMGLLSMSTKFAEVTLGVAYRRHEDQDDYARLYGGPMYYLRDGFKKRGLSFVGKPLAIVYALCCIAGAIGGANLFQANQTYQQVINISGGSDVGVFLSAYPWVFGLGLAVLVGVVIIGGIKSIARTASKIVPLMAVIYILAGLFVIALHYQNIPAALNEIVFGAFNFKAGLGGFIGALFVGVQRAAFSNESGLGTAAIVYAAARADHPVRQGMASMIGPFLDTVVVCTVTALVIVTTQSHVEGSGVEGIELTSRAFSTGGEWMPYLLAMAVFLFAYSSMITFAYYGVKCISFIFGQNDVIEFAFKVFFCLCAVLGCMVHLGALIDLTDAMILSMAIPNIIGLYVLAPEVKALLREYLAKEKI